MRKKTMIIILVIVLKIFLVKKKIKKGNYKCKNLSSDGSFKDEKFNCEKISSKEKDLDSCCIKNYKKD
jgi:hypothetical protein